MLLTQGEVAALLRVHRGTIWRWCKLGLFPAPMKIGRTRMWDEREIEDWKQSQRMVEAK